jgi:hypothetical protein
MSDSEFLRWLRSRLVNVYGESENVDFVQRLDRIIGELKEAEDYLNGTSNRALQKER